MSCNHRAAPEVCFANTECLVEAVSVLRDGQRIIAVQAVDILFQPEPELDPIPKCLDEYGISVFIFVYACITADKEAAQLPAEISENQKAVERVRDAYFEALDGMMAKEDTNSEGEEVYSIQYTKDNVPFVVTERDILDGVPEKDWVKTVKENLRGKFPDGVQIGKNTIKINQNSRRELTFSEYMKEVFRNDKTAYADKLRVTDNADEIVRASRNYVNEALHHERKDNIAQFARGNVLLRVGNNDYSADVIVGTKNNSDMLLYDIINLNKATIEERNKKQAQLTSQHKNAASRSAVPSGTVAQPTAKSNSDTEIKFSML